MPDKHVNLTDAVYDYVLNQSSGATDPLLHALYADTLALGRRLPGPGAEARRPVDSRHFDRVRLT